MWIYNASELGKHFKCYAVDTIGGPGLSVLEAAYDKNFEDSLWIEDAGHGINHESVKEVNSAIIEYH